MTRYKSRWANGKNNSEHKVVYEQHFGKVPDGFHIHHKNENKWDNDPSNLEAMHNLEHRRLHADNYQRQKDGEWVKLCGACGKTKSLDAFHVKTTVKGSRSTRWNCKSCRNTARMDGYNNKLQKRDEFLKKWVQS